MANGYAKLHQRLDRLEQQLQTLLDQHQAPPPPVPVQLPSPPPPAGTPPIDPFRQGAAAAVSRLADVEGPEALRERLAETIEQLVEAETLESLTRLAQLAPKLEYAATLAAAGPELLEEALEMVEHRLTKVPNLSYQLRELGGCLSQLSSPESLALLKMLVSAVPQIAPILRSATETLVNQEPRPNDPQALGAQLGLLAVHASKPATLDALTHVTERLPQLQYAIDAAAAGSELYEGSLKVIQQHVPNTTEALKRLETGVATLQQLLENTDLDHLAKLTALGTSATAYETVQDLMQLAPQLTKVLHALPVQPRTLDMLQTLNHAVEEATETRREVGAFGMMRAFSNPEVRRAAGFALQVAQALGAHLQTPADKQPSTPPERDA